jgi:selenide,water dikinase
MAERSGVRVVFDAGSIPALPGALAAAGEGVRTGGDARNRDFAGGVLEVNGIPDELVALGFDPQTAGGLLVSVAADKAAVLAASFQDEGLFLARVGRVEEGSGVAVS